MGQRGDKKVQARDENNIKGSWIKTVLKSVWVRGVTKRFKLEMKTI